MQVGSAAAVLYASDLRCNTKNLPRCYFSGWSRALLSGPGPDNLVRTGRSGRSIEDERYTDVANTQITARHWQFLRALARHGSIGSVARNEHHSETAVRRHLRDLSHACAVEVVDTSEGIARVTAAGMVLLDRLDPILDEQEYVTGRMQQLLTLREEDLARDAGPVSATAR
ncbi:helix-turn-helix domain-containing protein [Myceligenerans xiligouense]|uniref:helix-turn-helix domain-containing protein n=1 Tax=Myceligenerans xiligouense TaxID=253184 RepID=UPI000F5160DD|nr:LysR family transcriptional regulator [Myceligenerans xiligouense]